MSSAITARTGRLREPGSDVVVGVDPRRPSVPALFWAADEAARRGVRIRLVAAVQGGPHLMGDDLPGHSARRARAASALANAEDFVRELHPDLSPATELIDGPPVTVLRERAADAALLVLGARRAHRPAEALTEGLVVPSLAGRADCPVVVVRAPEHTQVHPRTVAVAADDTPEGRAAVAFGVREAQMRRARLRAVRVLPPSASACGDEDAARRRLSEFERTWTERHSGLDIVAEVLNGRPVEQLVLVSQSALALVVGRPLGGPGTADRLGPVIQGLLRHAECPVITVPTPPLRADRPPTESAPGLLSPS
ncbi:universal stress protein [Streptomyces sp. SID9727]|uniref:universal stress protein n=1 Tax=Streptomyces sp. SID9727 TaxID=2706114 RepID=UPI0013CACB39|nr:universal stress protein [Streptomyces sp. SID9727]NEC67710.1 universal stress protein [Streptomyces sp. SID9727]